jgi:hypothetical protein
VVHRSIIRIPNIVSDVSPFPRHKFLHHEDQLLISSFPYQFDIFFFNLLMIKILSRTVEKANMTLAWKRLIRFEAVDGRILRGEPVLPADKDIDLGFITEADKLQARILEGEDIYDTTGKTVLTEQTAQVKRVLSPLAQSDVPILRCVGLNYAKHSESSLIRTNKTTS